MSKINAISFAQLISRITALTNCNGDLSASLHVGIISDLYHAVEDCIPVLTLPPQVDPAVVNELLRAVRDGEKIPAIKAHRTLTGWGLKESKDAVEARWPRKPEMPKSFTKEQLFKKLNNDNSKGTWDSHQHTTIYNFINSLTETEGATLGDILGEAMRKRD